MQQQNPRVDKMHPKYIKKGDQRISSNHLHGKIYTRVLVMRVLLFVEPQSSRAVSLWSLYIKLWTSYPGYMCFIVLEKVYNHVTRGTLWRAS